MDIYLYKMTDEPKKLSKSLPSPYMLSGSLRDVSEVVNPVFRVAVNPIGYNYAYIPSFGRFYFIREMTSVRTNVMELQLHVDVLMSFNGAIRNCPIVAERSSDQYSGYVPDRQRAFNTYSYNSYHLLGSFNPAMGTWIVTAG